MMTGEALGYDDLCTVSELLRMLLKQPSMFGSDESYNEAVAVAERLRRHLETAERRRAFRASLRTGGGDD